MFYAFGSLQVQTNHGSSWSAGGMEACFALVEGIVWQICAVEWDKVSHFFVTLACIVSFCRGGGACLSSIEGKVLQDVGDTPLTLLLNQRAYTHCKSQGCTVLGLGSMRHIVSAAGL